MTRELPIDFAHHDVPKLLDGTKTQTRRIVKPQPETVDVPEEGFAHMGDDGLLCGRQRYLCGDPENPDIGVEVLSFPVAAPFRVGDVLWVRESWASLRFGYDIESEYVDDWSEVEPATVRSYLESGHAEFHRPRFSIVHREVWGSDDFHDRGFRWRSPVTMPRWAARIFLRVEEVRVEQVQDISEEDAQAEGVGPFLMGYAGVSADNMTEIESYRASFEDLWNTIHGEGAWARNDWVFIYHFSRIENYRAA